MPRPRYRDLAGPTPPPQWPPETPPGPDDAAEAFRLIAHAACALAACWAALWLLATALAS